MEPIRLTLTGRIYRDPETGYYISTIEEWDISTCGETLEKAVEMTWHTIDAYLEASRKLGTLAVDLAKAGVSGSAPAAALPARARLALDAAAGRTVIELERDVVLAS